MALGYKIALTNVWWNKGGQDIRLFANTTEQQTYFSNLGLYWNDLVNFNMNDNITTTITFKDKSGRDAETLLKCNYAIVWNTIKSTYRYYYIVSISQDSCNQVIVSLDLDDIQTNMIPNKDKIKNIYVKQWTGFNLFKDNTTYELMPDYETILNTGDTPVKFNQSTTEIFFNYTNKDSINEWLNENVACWRYIFAVQNNQLKAPIINDTSLTDLIVNISAISDGEINSNLPYAIFCVPIYKATATKNIYLKYNYGGADRYGKLTNVALDSLFTSISDNYPIGTYCIQEKYSNICPYNMLTNTTNFRIDNDGDLLITNSVDLSERYLIGQNLNYYLGGNALNSSLGLAKSLANSMFISGSFQRSTTIECEVDNPIKMTNLSEAEAKQICTKLLDANYSTFRLRITTQSYNYNPLALFKFTTNKLKLKYTEVLQVGISKIYLRFDYDIGVNKYYTEANTKDYTGLIASLDFSLPLLTNQWADYLANNKNYYLQTTFNNTIGLVQGTANNVAFSKNSKQALAGGFASGVGFASSFINQQLERENMQQAPDGLANGNGDPYFNIAIEGIKPKLDYLTITDLEREIALDKIKLEGTPRNKFYRDLSQLLNIHINYDILSCDLTYNSLDISLKEFNRLKDKMSIINRYWYNDTLNLDSLNYIP